MGVHKLIALLKEKSNEAFKEVELNKLAGKNLAINASICINQYYISTQGFNNFSGIGEYSDKKGNLTGHLIGILNKSILMLSSGIKPIWVFEGDVSELKLKKLIDDKNTEKMLNLTSNITEYENSKINHTSNVKITEKMIEDTKTLLTLLGLPYVEAPSEAESQCAELVKSEIAYGVLSDNLDCLVFGCSQIFNGLDKNEDYLISVDLNEVLNTLKIDMDQFIDFCILCGCDYTSTISNLGPTKALRLIQEYYKIENVIDYIEEENISGKLLSKYTYSLKNFKYKEARKIFKNSKVLKEKDLDVIFYD